MYAYTEEYVQTCMRCHASKALSQKPAGLLQPLSIPTRRWATVSLDFITGLPLSRQGHDAILTMVDALSKMAHFIPTITTASAEDVVHLLADRLVRYHGIPSQLITDRGHRFTSAVWQGLCKRFQIKRAMSSACHPQNDGQTERVNHVIEQLLRTYIQADEAEWEDLLPAAELAYNCTVHSSTVLTPFQILIGENPMRAADIDLLPQQLYYENPPMTKLFRLFVGRAATHIQRAKEQQKLYADKQRRPVDFQVGDKVWVSTRYMAPRGSPKLQQRYIGPFNVLERVGNMAYKVELPPSMPRHNVFHVSLLEKHKPRGSHMRQEDGFRPLEVNEAEGTARYEVEHKLDSRGEGSNLQYLVQWKGYPPEQATWEPAAHVHRCQDLLRAFRAKQGSSRRKRKHQAKT